MVVPYRKVNSMVDLNKDELAEIMELAQKSMKIIQNKLDSDGFNFGINIGKCSGAGIDDHVHFHIVPRWNGDNNFMPTIGNKINYFYVLVIFTFLVVWTLKMIKHKKDGQEHSSS